MHWKYKHFSSRTNFLRLSFLSYRGYLKSQIQTDREKIVVGNYFSPRCRHFSTQWAKKCFENMWVNSILGSPGRQDSPPSRTYRAKRKERSKFYVFVVQLFIKRWGVKIKISKWNIKYNRILNVDWTICGSSNSNY